MQFPWLVQIDALDRGLILVAALLLAGWVAGELAERARLPRIVGYALAGGAFGFADPLLAAVDLRPPARLLAEIGLGLLLYDLGRRVDFSWVRRDRNLAVTSALEMAATFGACYGVLSFMGVAPLGAAVSGVIALASSPAVVITVVRDLRAQGQVTERVLWLSAANTVVAALIATLIMAWLQQGETPSQMLLHSLWLVGGSLGFAAAMAWLLSAAGRLALPASSTRLVAGLAAVLLTLGFARWWGLSVPLALIALGLLTHRFDRQRGQRSPEFGELSKPVVVLFFVFAGTALAFVDIARFGWLALALVCARVAAKWLVVGLAGRLSRLDFRHTFRLGLALAPMSGLSIMLVSDMGALYPELGGTVAGILFTAIAILEVAGPVATHFAIKLSGESDEEHAHG